jgi:hypothetical protein
MKYFFYILTLSLFLFSCSDDTMRKLDITPTAYGNIDNIYVVTEKQNWDNNVGDSLRKYFEALYPVTPQPEPLFDVRFIESEKFSKVHKTHRVVLIVADLSKKEEVSTKMIYEALGEEKLKRAFVDQRYRIAVHKNRWAMDQIVIYWFAPDTKSLQETLSKDYQQVVNMVNKLDVEKLSKMVYADGKSPKINEQIKKQFEFEMNIPGGYEVAYQDSVTLWLFDESAKVSTNIMMHVINNADYKYISKDSILSFRNRLSKKYFSSWAEGSYMMVDNVNLPVFYQELLFGERKVLQARGIWKMEKDFMGGPFVTYMIPDFDRRRVILIDGFVYAPGQKKRPEMRKLDNIFSTFKYL